MLSPILVATEAVCSRGLLSEAGHFTRSNSKKGEIHHDTTDTVRGRFRLTQRAYT